MHALVPYSLPWVNGLWQWWWSRIGNVTTDNYCSNQLRAAYLSRLQPDASEGKLVTKLQRMTQELQSVADQWAPAITAHGRFNFLWPWFDAEYRLFRATPRRCEQFEYGTIVHRVLRTVLLGYKLPIKTMLTLEKRTWIELVRLVRMVYTWKPAIMKIVAVIEPSFVHWRSNLWAISLSLTPDGFLIFSDSRLKPVRKNTELSTSCYVFAYCRVTVNLLGMRGSLFTMRLIIFDRNAKFDTRLIFHVNRVQTRFPGK